MKNVVFGLGITTWCLFAKYHHQLHICRASVYVFPGSRTEDEKFEASGAASLKLLIVGGSLGGLSAAAFLRAAFQCASITVFEKREVPYTTTGAGPFL
jgi:hypothetical protein